MESTSTVARKAKPSISFFDLQAQFATIRREILQAVESVLESQHFILGQQVELFEQEAAEYVEAPFAVGCASGTDALYLALCAQGVGPGDEVITTPFTFVATAGSIARTGAKPVFVDIHSRYVQYQSRAHRAGDHQQIRAPSFRSICSDCLRRWIPSGHREETFTGRHRGCRAGDRSNLSRQKDWQHRRFRVLQLLSIKKPGLRRRRRYGHHGAQTNG